VLGLHMTENCGSLLDLEDSWSSLKRVKRGHFELRGTGCVLLSRISRFTVLGD
jgi:hypothetical protein